MKIVACVEFSFSDDYDNHTTVSLGVGRSVEEAVLEARNAVPMDVAYDIARVATAYRVHEGESQMMENVAFNWNKMEFDCDEGTWMEDETGDAAMFVAHN